MSSKPLTPELLNYLVEFKYMFSKRSRLIDFLTVVHRDTRNTIILSDTEYNSFTNSLTKSIQLNLSSVAEDYTFQRPLSTDMLTQQEKNNPIILWKSTSGCELISKAGSFYDIFRTFRNWLAMDQDQKSISDVKCQELFGKDNLTLFVNIVKNTDISDIKGDIVRLVNQSNTKSSFAYISTVKYDDSDLVITLKYLAEDTGARICGETDTFDLTQAMTPLKTSDKPEMTTVGRFITNTLLADEPFKDKSRFPYNYGEWNIGKFHDQLAKMMVSDKNRLSVEEFKTYANNFFFLGSFTELCVPSLTLKALGTDPNMKALKEKLYRENKEAIDKGDPVAIAEMESKLIARDKEYLKDDTSMRFYGPLGGKPFNIARKKMYLTVGGIEEFSKHTGSYNYVERALSEGWDPKTIPVIANEIRSGSYKRGHETQLGGAETKYIVRVFHDYCTKIEDCGTDRGIMADFRVIPIKDYIGRYVKDGNAWVDITSENMSKYDKGVWLMRSPQTCKSKEGLCYKCCGKRFAELKIEHVSMMLAELSSVFTKQALKSMHGTKLSVYDINDLDSFIL